MRQAAYVSLFSGAGGLDLGLEQAGWRAAYVCDVDVNAVATLRSNAGFETGGGGKALGDTCIEQADVTTLTAGRVLSSSGLRKGDVALLAGGPPCQSWSSAGLQLGFADARGRLFEDFVRMAGELDARWLLLENVRGLLTARGPDGQPGSALAHVRLCLLGAGFQTTVALLNAADFGVPQRRVRLFIIGFRAGDTPRFPSPTHDKAPASNDTRGWVPLSAALDAVRSLSDAEVIRPTAKLEAELAALPPGSGVKSPGKSERTRPGGHWGYKQGAFIADPALPARTVTAGAQQDWIRDPARGLRRLCPRECAAIQSFPPGWRFSGNHADQYRLIGNAVPPLVARAIGAQLSDALAADDLHGRGCFDGLMPLPACLEYHVRYTAREEASNGASRREAPSRRRPPPSGTATLSACR